MAELDLNADPSSDEEDVKPTIGIKRERDAIKSEREDVVAAKASRIDQQSETLHLEAANQTSSSTANPPSSSGSSSSSSNPSYLSSPQATLHTPTIALPESNEPAALSSSNVHTNGSATNTPFPLSFSAYPPSYSAPPRSPPRLPISPPPPIPTIPLISQLEEQVARDRALARREEFLAGAQLEMFDDHADDEDTQTIQQPEEANFGVEVRSMLFRIPITALALHDRCKSYGDWILPHKQIFQFRIESTQDEVDVLVDGDGKCLPKKSRLYMPPKRQQYDSKREMLILEFGGFRFNFASIDFTVSQWEIDKRQYGDSDKGYGLVKKNLELADFTPGTEGPNNALRIVGQFNEEDEDESTKDCYIDLNQYQLRGTTKCEHHLSKGPAEWEMNARLIKFEEFYRLSDPEAPEPIPMHDIDFDVDLE